MCKALLLAVLFSPCSVALTGAVHVACNPPTEYVDGTPFTQADIGSYLIYLTSPDGSTVEIRRDTCELDLVLPYGDYSHRDVVCDTNLNCSSKSTIRRFRIKSPPKKPLYPSVRAI